LIIDQDIGSIIDANDAAKKFYGWPMTRLKRMRIQDINTLSSEEIKRAMKKVKSGKQDQSFYQNLWKTISSGRVWKGRMVNKRKDGSLYHEVATISPVFDSSGKIVNYVAVKRDITAINPLSIFRWCRTDEPVIENMRYILLHRYIMRYHPLSHCLIRQPAEPGTHVVYHMVNPGCGGDNTGHSRMGQNELQKILTPTPAVDLGCPIRKVSASSFAKQIAPLKGPVDQGGDTLVRGQGQKAFLNNTILQVVGELNEIQILRLHDPLKCFMLSAVRGCNADVPDNALLFPFLQNWQMSLPVPKVVNLHQVHDLDPHALHGFLHLCDAALPTVGPDFRGGEYRILVSGCPEKVSQDRFRPSIHG
jgi:PAS domain S-box-containing protein